ncbi:hypothetical protein M8R19_27345 [Pseudomonas sp. R3.Fl]|uniref:hypothetical protein n=1 Tax=Pseudomonas TaxID=286 RepID=UPI00201E5C27|nr:hypothetical protein [Pseudomonas sp. R3.Fl]MCL6692408.1 hypothetical protein [Pseudomonas sp. R3.Fl]
MKRTKREYDLELDPSACYKMEFVHNESRESFESTEKWLYLGANARDSEFAKVGITMGDLTTRSSSSENPGYYLFCAFKCRNNIARSQLEDIEKSALNHLERVFVYPDGSTKRALHHESGHISECFYDVDFLFFFGELHYYLYQNYCNYFMLSGFENEAGVDEGEFLDCEFNTRRMSRDEINKHIRRILQ